MPLDTIVSLSLSLSLSLSIYIYINRSIKILCSLEKEIPVLQEREKAEKQEQAVLTTTQHVTQPAGGIARLAETREETVSACGSQICQVVTHTH
jgi:hypothetical protein